MSSTFVQDVTAMRHGIDETHRRFEGHLENGLSLKNWLNYYR